MEMGYTNVKNYADGYNKWLELGKPIKRIDKAPESLLFSLPEKVTDNIYSAIGATAPGTYANSGHNNNLSFIITDEGVVLFNAGDNYLLAKALHHEIKELTDKPIKYVILENAQGHAMLGSNYWKEQGAEIIMHVDSYKELNHYGEQVIERMKTGRRDKGQWTKLPPVILALWIPKQKVLITGDLAFHERLMPIFEHTDTAGWIGTWDKVEALKAEKIIPGHGSPTNITEVTKYTKDYLVYMRGEVEKILDDDGTEQDAYNIDQSGFSHLDTFNELALQNAGRIFRQMEFDAEDLYQILRDDDSKIGLATIYRVLTQFETAGLVIRHNFEGGQAVFELDQGDHHDHIVDMKNGKIIEFHDEIIEQRQIEIAKEHGYKLVDHSLILYAEKE
ncbi:Ferric uptake regulation protein [Nymphon striatum]|nr:Ferric uptake regulation protein [Nymphon striatum]